ncbi:hypothetical protein CMUS01_07420 [Colletotrichum musicola]|uniref:Aminotransferase class I/classII large domain-containing protein n=1 Tax=Colletotrichum musicola TaxID=2175873 RepID=A0A8H6NFS2_9PEZI|nr:hypothetical protein CMUS01_07420 [Colletotrichum musicola]
MESDNLVQWAISEQRVSRRGAYNFAHRDIWGPREKSMANPWSPSNPDGTVILRLAENSLLHDEVAKFIKEEINVLPLNHLTYSTGPRGSVRLRRALGAFLTETLQAREAITSDDLFITPGLASGLDAIAWSVCDDNEGILIPQPFWNGFSFDLLNRSNAKVIGVPYTGIEGFKGLDDLFRPEVNKRALEAALRKAHNDGITVRALIISNPHNPLGRCYPPETLREFASFCGREGLHFISDEIYAKSVFPNPAIPEQASFVSVLALDLQEVISPHFVHVLYGASKDFCANGLRLGAICTKNKAILGAISSISMCSWSPHVVQDVWAAMLENKNWTANFLDKKKAMMLENYETATSFFRKHEIDYCEMNAGLFIWVDLRRLFTSSSKTQDHETNLRRELEITKTCLAQGVMIAAGSVYYPEDFGWFRVTFCLGKEALEEGLRRFARALAEL